MAKKKINYAAMFTLRKDGRYQTSYLDDRGVRRIYMIGMPKSFTIQATRTRRSPNKRFKDACGGWQDTRLKRIV